VSVCILWYHWRPLTVVNKNVLVHRVSFGFFFGNATVPAHTTRPLTNHQLIYTVSKTVPFIVWINPSKWIDFSNFVERILKKLAKFNSWNPCFSRDAMQLVMQSFEPSLEPILALQPDHEPPICINLTFYFFFILHILSNTDVIRPILCMQTAWIELPPGEWLEIYCVIKTLLNIQMVIMIQCKYSSAKFLIINMY